MASKTIMASVRAKILNLHQGVSPIGAKKYLDTDDIATPEWGLEVTTSGGLLATDSPTTNTAATLIDAINAISSNQTTETLINMTVTYGSKGGNATSTFTIIIDWENDSVIWSGSQIGTDVAKHQYSGSAKVPGILEIGPIGGGETAAVLGTTLERKISRLPILGLTIPLNTAVIWMALVGWDGFYNTEYQIRTTQNITVVPECPPCEVCPECPPEVPATECPDPIVCEPCAPCDPAVPCPPAEPCSPCPDPAVALGIKISELPSVGTASSLQDDDLFVLSQDKPDDGIYDISYHATLATLKAALSASYQSGIWVAGNTLSISTTNVTSCGISIATGLNVTAAEQDETGNIMGQFDVSSKILYLAQVYTGGSGSNATPMESTVTLTAVLQDMLIKPVYNGVTVKARFDADTLYIELTGANMRGTYQITLS